MESSCFKFSLSESLDDRLQGALLVLGVFLQSRREPSRDNALNGPIYQIGLSINESSATGNTLLCDMTGIDSAELIASNKLR